MWFENNVTAQEVMALVAKSPNLSQFTPEQWDSWAAKWGLTGEFRRVMLSALKLADLVDNKRRLRININMSPGTLADKQQTGQRNTIVITHLPSPVAGYDYQVVDGNHSLVTAARNALSTGKDEQLPAIVPVDWPF